ncbi:MAG: cyclic nucleotide-binding domain-containing protein [SAR324 cluster bacterium]|nr:cyclic nucleotide-binding domain-containing protein [SAR324 cluster bacterium]
MSPFTNYLKNILPENKNARQALRHLKSFHHASEELLDIVYKYGKVLKLSPGEILIKEGDFDQWIFLILKGSLSVYVKDQRLDKVSSSLVGERCILGEPRKASLKADDEVFAFGLDMSLTDALQKDGVSFELREALNELLLMLLEQVLDRVFHLWSSQTLNAKLGDERITLSKHQQIIDSLSNEDFAHQPEIITYLWWYIKNSENISPDKFWCTKGHYFNTRKLVIHYLRAGKNHELFKLVASLHRWQQSIGDTNDKKDALAPDLIDYSVITEPFKLFLEDFLKDYPQAIEQIRLNWDNFFSIGDYSQIKLVVLDKILVTNLIPLENISDLLIGLIDKSLLVNQQLNSNLYQMNSYYGLMPEREGKSTFAIPNHNYQKELELQNLEYLQKELIFPYLKALEKEIGPIFPKEEIISPETQSIEDEKIKDSQTSEIAPGEQGKEAPKDLSNFDELLKQLGATPGVPMD